MFIEEIDFDYDGFKELMHKLPTLLGIDINKTNEV